jgi:hypothetical protein
MQNIGCLIRFLACCLYRSLESGDKQFWGLITHISGNSISLVRPTGSSDERKISVRPISLLNQPIGGLNAHRSPVSLRSVFFCCHGPSTRDYAPVGVVVWTIIFSDRTPRYSSSALIHFVRSCSGSELCRSARPTALAQAGERFSAGHRLLQVRPGAGPMRDR